jgi:hypothetical protein
MLAVAAGLGLTTACDRIAIESSSAMTYSFVWACVSSVVMSLLLIRCKQTEIRKYVLSHHTFLQAVFWAAAFVLQMAAVQAAKGVSSGVTYVKLLTMMNILVTVGIGGRMFSEGHVAKSLIASVIMVAGAAVMIIFK